MSALLSFDGVSCARGGRMLFEGLSFALEPGAAVLVTGPNGAGKSSLVRVAAGLLDPVAGRVECAGRRAMLGERNALDPELPLLAALGFWAGFDTPGDLVPMAVSLSSVGLSSLARVPVRYLSTGQRRRAAIARVLAGGAPVWLLDEPANGLDAESVAMLERILAVHRSGGGALVVASHVPLELPGAVEIALGAA